MADPISASVAAVVSYVSTAFAASAAGTATLAQAATVFAVTTAANIGVAAILTPQVGAGGSPTEWAADPDAAIPFVMGRRGVAGKIVHRDEWGPDNRYQSLVSVYSAAGPIKSFGTFKADLETCTFAGTYGRQTSGTWKDVFWRDTRLGAQPDTALQTPAQKGDPTVSGAMPEWDASYKLSGKACSMLTAAMDSKRQRWPGDLPKCLQDIEGIYGYDPRADSTYPGGSGSCRLNDRTTWPWISNPIIGALNFELGLKENGRLVGGLGASADRIDMAACVEAANVADANNWTLSAYWTSADSKHQVLTGFLQAGGALYAQNGGQLSCVTRGAPRTSIATVTAADTAGPIEISAAASRLGRINAIIPKCVLESQSWATVPIDEVSVAAFETEDGGKRARGITYVFVDDPVQTSQLAAYDICDSREGITGRIPLKAYMRELKPGDAFTISEPEFVLDGLKVLVLQRDFDPITSIVTITFRSETDSKHPFALGLNPTPPTAPSLTPASLYVFPQPPLADWIATAITIDGENGETRPAVELIGDVTVARTQLVELQYRYRAGDGAGGWGASTAWAVWGYLDPAESRAVIEGFPPASQVDIRVSYISQDGVRSTEPRDLEPVTVAAEVVVTGSVNVGAGSGSRPSTQVLAALDAATSAATDLLAQTDQLANTIMQDALDRREEVDRRVTEIFGAFGSASVFVQGAFDAQTLAAAAQAQAAAAQAAAETASAGANSSASTAVSAAGDAGASATAAATSATAAAASVEAGEEFATAAELSATNAATSASSAGTSATEASTSETNAAGSAAAASSSAEVAATAASSSGASASAASTSASSAASAATEAGTAATAAEGSRVAAETAQGAASSSAFSAASSATDAAGSASSASTSASAAASSAGSAGASAAASSTSESNAATSASAAGASATAAAGSATTASTGASTATTKATEASTSAANAASSATAASTSAANAAGYATTATGAASAASASASSASTSSILSATFGASAKQDVQNADAFFTTNLDSLVFSTGSLSGVWSESFISGVGYVVATSSDEVAFASRARFVPVPERRYRVTVRWRYTSGSPGTVLVGFRYINSDGSGSADNRWGALTPGAVNEWREGSYEITATAAMGQESWRPFLYRGGSTQPIEVASLLWQDVSALRAAGGDATIVYSTANEAYAARIEQVSAGAASASISFVAAQSNGVAASRIVIAAQTVAFGIDERIEATSTGELIGWNAARDVRQLEWNPTDDALRIRKVDGTLMFDSSDGGMTSAGLKANSVTTTDYTTTTTNSPAWTTYTTFTNIEFARHTSPSLTAGSVANINCLFALSEILNTANFILSLTGLSTSPARDILLQLIRDPDGTPVLLKSLPLRTNLIGGSDIGTAGQICDADFLYRDTGHGGGSTTYALRIVSYNTGTTTLNSAKIGWNQIDRTISVFQTIK